MSPSIFGTTAVKAGAHRLKRTLSGAAIAAAALALTAACATASNTAPAANANTTSSGTPATELRLGYFANVTHTTPIVGVAKNFFTDKLGSTKLSTQIFNAGPDEMTALLGGQLDAAYVGPSSALNAYVKSKGTGLTIVAGAENAGAELVVSSKINSAADLKGKTLASPQLGNTQDVALRYWLKQQGYATTQQGGGDVNIQPSDNATTLTLFEAGKIDGAWVPEPWASRLVVEGKGHVLVDEKTLWPNGQFATTNLVVATSYLKAHPQTVKALIEGQLDANAWVTANPTAAATLVNSSIKTLTGKALAADVITRAWGEENVTNDPEAGSLQTSLDHAVAVGLLKQTSLNGIFDLTLLNQALTAAGDPAVSSAGLGSQ
ncbi:MAG TPA: ABC transporter substrate-binding protein [Actinocrinis sp.]|uniref:ABC transporter substrate-binding protein n=1 Tax=Actinocrinis sp. TaxID=1920516 RepID=UPI002DDCC142|nr:ABC transporter substrate-binding protein [Actinocrinis sp.]HEV3171594.1 ABC transporter substrate-binding protein [Actinocrinis sp.]